ncbi:zinc-ribbon domain-containing protein [Caproicibacterium sp. BJN0003]
MRCSNCNQILSDDWTFCPFCGKKRILNIRKLQVQVGHPR